MNRIRNIRLLATSSQHLHDVNHTVVYISEVEKPLHYANNLAELVHPNDAIVHVLFKRIQLHKIKMYRCLADYKTLPFVLSDIVRLSGQEDLGRQ